MDIIKRLVGLMSRYRKRIALALSLQLIAIISRLCAPFFTRDIINNIITPFFESTQSGAATAGPNLDLLWPLCGGILGLTAARAICTYIRGLLLERTSQNVVYDLRTNLYAHMQELPYVFYDNHRIGEIMSRMTGDIEGIRGLIGGGLVTVFDNLLNFIGALIFLSIMSWQLMLALLIFAPLLALSAWQFNKRIRPAFREIREQNAVLNTRTQENLAGMRVVKAFAREPYESDRFAADNDRLTELHINATRIWKNFVPFMEFLSGMCMPVMLLVGGYMVLNDQIQIGTLIAVNGYVWLITNPMRSLSNIINMVAQAITSAEKLFYYVDFGSSIREPEDAETPAAFKGHVVFDHVNFSYGGEPVLKDITFEAKPGQTVAVMGATGSGKSTLVTLLGRYYDIQSGSITIDGIDVRRQKLKPMRREIGYVMQETFLFSDTLEDNIRFGRPNAEMARVQRAAQVAQATEFIDHMPRGYDTIVGERGLGLSGGQKQRVAIARAVLTEPSILVMDDSTSAVDMETEYLIQQDLKNVLAGRTTFVIAHRISSVKNADLILVLDGGAVAERGTHSELIAQKGIYYGMVQDQYRDFDMMAARKAGEA